MFRLTEAREGINPDLKNILTRMDEQFADEEVVSSDAIIEPVSQRFHLNPNKVRGKLHYLVFELGCVDVGSIHRTTSFPRRTVWLWDKEPAKAVEALLYNCCLLQETNPRVGRQRLVDSTRTLIGPHLGQYLKDDPKTVIKIGEGSNTELIPIQFMAGFSRQDLRSLQDSLAKPYVLPYEEFSTGKSCGGKPVVMGQFLQLVRLVMDVHGQERLRQEGFNLKPPVLNKYYPVTNDEVAQCANLIAKDWLAIERQSGKLLPDLLALFQHLYKE